MAKKTSTPVITSARFCAARFPKPPKIAKDVSPDRARLIRQTANRWLNGTTLRYWFFDKPAKWTAPKREMDVVRAAFKAWKALGIGLDFIEVKKQDEADIRIAFEQGDGSWSYLGTDIRTRRSDPRTMNFGWSLVEDPQEGMDTAIHEIGHTLAFPHEHQNPFAGIAWDEEAVYRSLAAPPNSWSRQTTFHNIIRKIEPDTVKGSNWDPDSVMHYPFEAGLILKPAKYSKGLSPAGGLSPHDREWVQTLYPPLKAADAIPLNAVIFVDPDPKVTTRKVEELKNQWLKVTGQIAFLNRPGTNEFMTAVLVTPTEHEPVDQLVKVVPPDPNPYAN